jgi:GNAT superfamily N-acetyltransferase
MKPHRRVAELASQAVEALREEGPAGLWIRFVQWLGIYRRFVVCGGRVPGPPEPARIPVECAILRPDQVEEYLAFRPDQDAAEIRGRLDAGNRCFVARSDGRIIGSLWCFERRAWIEYVGCEILLADDTYFVDDEYVLPDFRGLRVADALLALHRVLMQEAGYRRSACLIWPENRVAAHRAERRQNAVIGELACFRLGPWRRHILQIKPSRREPMVALAPRD